MNNEKIGMFIKSLREEKNLSQGELASILFVDRTLISKWEKGVAVISSANLTNLSKFFKITVDELLAGKRKTKDNKKEIENVKLDIYDNLNNKVKKQHNRILILLLSLFVVVFLFLLVFFLNFYSSVKIYRLTYSTESFYSISGLFFENKDRVYFYLDSDFNNQKDNIKRVSLYYKIKDERVDIYSKSYPEVIHFLDYNGYNEYIDFNKVDEIINNMYIEIELNDKTLESSKINFHLDYINKKVFGEKIKSISDNYKRPEEKEYNDSELTKKVKLLSAIYESKEYYDKVKYNDLEYEVIMFPETLYINYQFQGEKYTYEYITFNGGFLEYGKEEKDQELNKIYTYHLGSNKCSNGKCDTYEYDIKIVEKIVELLLKKNEKK